MKNGFLRSLSGCLTLILFVGVGRVQLTHAQVIMLKNEGQIIVTPVELVKPGQAYFIKNKATQKVLDVKNGSSNPGTAVQQATLNGKIAQKFVFENAEEAGYFL